MISLLTVSDSCVLFPTLRVEALQRQDKKIKSKANWQHVSSGHIWEVLSQFCVASVLMLAVIGNGLIIQTLNGLPVLRWMVVVVVGWQVCSTEALFLTHPPVLCTVIPQEAQGLRV